MNLIYLLYSNFSFITTKRFDSNIEIIKLVKFTWNGAVCFSDMYSKCIRDTFLYHSYFAAVKKQTWIKEHFSIQFTLLGLLMTFLSSDPFVRSKSIQMSTTFATLEVWYEIKYSKRQYYNWNIAPALVIMMIFN